MLYKEIKIFISILYIYFKNHIFFSLNLLKNIIFIKNNKNKNIKIISDMNKD